MIRLSPASASASRLDVAIADLVSFFAGYTADRRITPAEAVLATLICSHEDNNRAASSLLAADRSALHLRALVRRHYDGSRRLPVLTVSDPAAGGFADMAEMPLHLPAGRVRA